MNRVKQVLVAAALATIGAASASAMPISNLTGVDNATNVETVRWVCGPYRCWWRPNYYGYGPGYGLYRPYYRPYRYYRPYYGWHRRPYWY